MVQAMMIASCQCGSEVVHARHMMLVCAACNPTGLTKACTWMVAVTSVPRLLDTASPPPVADGGSSGTAAVALLLQAAPQAWGCCSTWAAGRAAHSRPAQLLLPVLQHLWAPEPCVRVCRRVSMCVCCCQVCERPL